MKSGANFKDRGKIKAMADEGQGAKQIAEALKLPLACVESFMPDAEDPGTASKAAATLAEEAGIDLSAIEGTGKNGSITKGDVEAAIAAAAAE